LTQQRQQALVRELLSPSFAKYVNEKAKALSISPAEVIVRAIKEQFGDE
jgi:hypothetical protein